MAYSRERCFFILIALLLFILAGCSDKKAIEAEQKAKIEQTRAILANTCKQDSDCIVTGCRKTLCRTMEEEEFCDHRIVLSLEDKEDLGAVEKIVKQQLTIREAETLRIGGYSAGQWTLSFQAPLQQRLRVEQAIENFSLSGLAILHANANDDSKRVLDAFAGDPDVGLKSMRGAGMLLEKQIRSGDLLSKDDIRDTWMGMQPKLESVMDPGDVEHLWAHDVITGKIAYLRLWPIDSRYRLGVKTWSSLSIKKENGDYHVEGSLDEDDAVALEGWTEDHRLIVLLLGNEVLASAVPLSRIDDGKFDIIIKSSANDDELGDALEALKAVSKMKGSVRIDRDATARVERDIECHKQHPRDCACVDGTCAWKSNTDYNACLYE